MTSEFFIGCSIIILYILLFWLGLSWNKMEERIEILEEINKNHNNKRRLEEK